MSVMIYYNIILCTARRVWGTCFCGLQVGTEKYAYYLHYIILYVYSHNIGTYNVCWLCIGTPKAIYRSNNPSRGYTHFS